MSSKAFILSMYFVALFLTIKNYYNKGGKGMPHPMAVTAPSYLYGILALTADFTGGFSTVLAAGLTAGLFYRTHKQSKSGGAGTSSNLTFFPTILPPVAKPQTTKKKR